MFFDFIANENLKFVLQLQVGGGNTNGGWGRDGFALGQGDSATGKNTSIMTRQAYLDFNVPDTLVNVKAGYMTVTLPGYVGGSSILDDEVSAALVTAPIIDKTLSVLVGYMRLWDASSANNTVNRNSQTFGGYGMRDEFDAFVLALPIKLDGIEAAPFFVYGWGGKDSLNDPYQNNPLNGPSGDKGRLRGLLTPGLGANSVVAGSTNPVKFQKDLSAWWAGLTGKVTMFDPIWFAAGFNYGSLSGGQAIDGAVAGWDNKHILDRAGWIADFAIGYNGLSMVKPKIWFAYSSGEDSDPLNGSERMPMLSAYPKYTPFYFGNSISSSSGTMLANVDQANERAGYWALGLTLEKITFLEKLTHDFYFAYIKGTNSASLLTDPNLAFGGNANVDLRRGGIAANGGTTQPGAYMPGQFLTTKDSLFEFDFNTQYKIFEELTAVVELGYIIQNLDKDTWNTYMLGSSNPANNNGLKFNDAIKCMVGLSYDF